MTVSDLALLRTQQMQYLAQEMSELLRDLSNDPGQQRECVELWMRNQPIATHAALCLHFGIHWYQGGESCFAEHLNETEKQLWFVGIPVHWPSAELPVHENWADLVTSASAQWDLMKRFMAQVETAPARKTVALSDYEY